MNTKIAKGLNLATWCVAFLVLMIQVFTGKPAEQITGNIIATLFWMAVYYFFFYIVAPKLLLEKKLLLFFAVSAVIVIILPFIGYTLLFISRALFNGDFSNLYQGYNSGMHFSGLKAISLAGVYGSFFRLISAHF